MSQQSKSPDTDSHKGRGRLRNRARHRTVVDSDLLQDPRLNLAAKGLYAMLLSLPDDWTFRKPDLIKRAGVGRDAFDTAMRTLKTLGLVTSWQRNVPGEPPEWQIEVTDQIGDFSYEPRAYQHKLALQPKAENPTSASEEPKPENPSSEGGAKPDFPTPENRPPINQRNSNLTPLKPPQGGQAASDDAGGGLGDLGVQDQGPPEPPPDPKPKAAVVVDAIAAKHSAARAWACPEVLEGWIAEGLSLEAIIGGVMASGSLERARSWKYFDRQVRAKAQDLTQAAQASAELRRAKDPKLQILVDEAWKRGETSLAGNLRMATLDGARLTFSGRAGALWRSKVAEQACHVRALASACGLELAREVVA